MLRFRVHFIRHDIRQGLSVNSCSKEAGEVKYALQFSNSHVTKVHAIQQSVADKHVDQLTQTLEKTALQLEKQEDLLESTEQLLYGVFHI